MKHRRTTSIRHKQMFLIMLTSAVVLLLACAAFMVYDYFAFRAEMVEKVSSLSEVVGNVSPGAIDFDDSTAGRQYVSSLQGEPNIVQARLYRLNGELVAEYTRPGAELPPELPYQSEPGQAFVNNHLIVFRPVVQSGEQNGTVEVIADLEAVRSRLWRYAGIVAVVFVGALLVAFWLSAILGRVVSAPILHLSLVAQRVAADKNYSVRATKQSDDELGQLIDGFNEMLAQIQARDLELEGARNELERRVNQRTQELAGSLSLLNATLESTADGIVAVDLSGRVVSCNSKFTAIWGLPANVFEWRDEAKLRACIAPQIKDPEEFHQAVDDSLTQPEAETFDTVELKDGRIFERYAKPQRIHNKCVGVVVNWRDVTARKTAEAEVERTHGQLLEISRQAGMAEVATSVLHNVGNVLNSVNTSASVVADRIKRFSPDRISNLADLLQANRGNLAEFLNADGRADQIIDYLNTLAQFITSEHKALRDELHHLTRNVDHIKEIVAMQQDYARICGLTEQAPPTDLVEDALRMNDTALVRHRIRLVREYDPDLPPITVERHKVLQILVNLIRNAKQACSEAGHDDKQLHIRINRASDRVRIAVADNGIGIPAENLTRIFNHGFTTRKNGHGFGLHNGALAAREMGGHLSVHSDGVGRGATFTLELPISRDHT